MKHLLKRIDYLAILRIVAIYAFASALWIYLSDHVVGFLIRDTATIIRISVFKGFLFIILTSFLLYKLIARYILGAKQADLALLQSENRLNKAQEIAHLGSWELDVVSNTLTWSDEVYRILGLQPQGFIATYEAFLEAVHPDDRQAVHSSYAESLREGRDTYEIEHRVVRKLTGEIRYVHEKCEHVRNGSGKIIRSVGMIQDITERKGHEDQLLYLANYDILTALPNRNLLNDRFNQAITIEKRHLHRFLAIMLMDLDNFKVVNDTQGHTAGDLLLQEVASRILAAVKNSDTVARLGGDEFVVLPINASTGQDVARIAEQIISALSRPFLIDGREIFLTVSIGIVNYPNDGNSLDVLLKHADVAMYHAKHVGKNNYQFFTDEINNKIHERLAIETQLRRALEREEFILHYQPQIELKTGQLVGVEALLRWQSEDLPNNFVQILEETGLIIAVGEWVLMTACRQLSKWRHAGHDLHLSINISARQFHTINIAERIINIVQNCGCAPGQICLELTESIIMKDSEEIIQKLELLREMGFSLAIDDFGTGFSSLNYLKRMPISELKIDRTFIATLPSSLKDAAIVSTIIQLAYQLNMKVVAEGVETEEQLHFLSENSCHEGQGYFFSKPLPPDEIDLFLTRR